VKRSVSTLKNEVGSLRSTVRHIDDRTRRSEALLGEIQIDQHASRRAVEAIAAHFHIDVPKPVPPAADPGDAPPPDAEPPEDDGDVRPG